MNACRPETVLFVDDEVNVLRGLWRALRRQAPEWTPRFANSVAEAKQVLTDTHVDVVVSDVTMPGEDGFALLSWLQADPELNHVPVVMLTGINSREIKRRALELGAADLLNKPIDPEDLLARIRNTAQMKRQQDQIREHRAELERQVAERTWELEHSRLDIIWCLARAAEERDGVTGMHVVRVAAYCREVARVLGCEEPFIRLLALASPLHDVGKIGIPDHILTKRGRLTAAEWEVMHRHPEIGARILDPDPESARLFAAVQDGGQPTGPSTSSPLLEMASRIALTHHEHWDGGGYPAGMQGDAIPLESRITAVADVYDALRSSRQYKPAYSEDRTLHLMREQVGRYFDPAVYAAFLQSLPEIRSIFDEFQETSRTSDAA